MGHRLRRCTDGIGVPDVRRWKHQLGAAAFRGGEAEEAVVVELLLQGGAGVVIKPDPADALRAVVVVLLRSLRAPQGGVRRCIVQAVQGLQRGRVSQKIQAAQSVKAEGGAIGTVGPQGGGPPLGGLRRALIPPAGGDGQPQFPGQGLHPGRLLALGGLLVVVDRQLGELVQTALRGVAAHLLGGILHDGDPPPGVGQAPHVIRDGRPPPPGSSLRATRRNPNPSSLCRPHKPPSSPG